jgi:hypothetical protein
MLPVCHGKYGSEQDHRKQNRENELATSDFFNERRTDQENRESNEKLDRGKATEPETGYGAHELPCKKNGAQLTETIYVRTSSDTTPDSRIFVRAAPMETGGFILSIVGFVCVKKRIPRLF